MLLSPDWRGGSRKLLADIIGTCTDLLNWLYLRQVVPFCTLRDIDRQYVLSEGL
jgi:hypothetical protein